MVLFVLRKLILKTRVRSHPVGLDVSFLVEPFIYLRTSCVRTAKALARLRGCAGSPELSLVAYVISTIISWAGSYVFMEKEWKANSCRSEEDNLQGYTAYVFMEKVWKAYSCRSEEENLQGHTAYVFMEKVWKAYPCRSEEENLHSMIYMFLWTNMEIISKLPINTHLNPYKPSSHFWDIGKQCRPRTRRLRPIRVFIVC